MSEREKHEIIGRSVLELKECRSNLAALMAKARAYAESMRVVAQELCHVEIHNGPGSFPSIRPEVAIKNYPDRALVAELQKEIGDTKARIEALSKSLSDMGASELGI